MEDSKIKKIICYLFCDNLVMRKYKLKKLSAMLEPINFDKIKEYVNTTRYKGTRSIEQIKENELNELINNFESVLKENFNIEDLHNFLYNKEWFKIIIKKVSLENIIFHKEVLGNYDVKKNSITVLKSDISEAIYHELFHLSSTDTDANNKSSGFSLNYDNHLIANSLNEGYTQLLTEKYFTKIEEDIYLYEKRIALNLETIVTKEKMQSLYMNSDFFGLVKELEKYYNKEEIEKFIVNVDVIGEYMTNKNLVGLDEVSIINDLLERNICFLIKGYCKLLKKQKLSIEETKNKLIDYLYIMDIKYIERENDYEYDICKINKVIEQNLGIEYTLDLDILKIDDVCYNK